jgi:hypothetical protein
MVRSHRGLICRAVGVLEEDAQTALLVEREDGRRRNRCAAMRTIGRDASPCATIGREVRASVVGRGAPASRRRHLAQGSVGDAFMRLDRFGQPGCDR